MSAKDISLLIHFILEGIAALKVFISDEKVRSAFKDLKVAESDKDRQLVAARIAALIYKS